MCNAVRCERIVSTTHIIDGDFHFASQYLLIVHLLQANNLDICIHKAKSIPLTANKCCVNKKFTCVNFKPTVPINNRLTGCSVRLQRLVELKEYTLAISEQYYKC